MPSQYSLMTGKVKNLRGIRQPYGWFVLSVYEEFISQNPNDEIDYNMLIKNCQVYWEKLTEEQRETFNEFTKRDEERYHNELAEFLEYFQDELGRKLSNNESGKVNKSKNKLKRPMTPYFRFTHKSGIFDYMKETHPGLKAPEIQKLISVQWNSLTKEGKQRYVDEFNEETKIYKKVPKN